MGVLMDDKKLDEMEEAWIKEGSKLYDQDAVELFRLARLGSMSEIQSLSATTVDSPAESQRA